MKRLLVLLIVAPFMLQGQTRQQVIIDSIKAAAPDLRRVSEIAGRIPGVNATHMQVSDSGEYVTLVIRLHVKERAVIRSLYISPVMTAKITELAAHQPATVTIPPLPPPVTGLPVPFLTVSLLSTAGTSIVNMAEAAVPPLLNTIPWLPEAIPVRPVALFSVDAIVIAKPDTMQVLPLPELQLGIIDPVRPCALISIPVKTTPPRPPDTVFVPVFEEQRMPVEGMHLSDEGYSLLEKLEGFSPELYSLSDGGLTIGFGFFIPNDEVGKWGKGVTWEEAEVIIRQKVPQYEDQVKQYINVPLTQREFDALTLLAYNLGGFAKATSIVNDINGYADFEQLQKDWKRFVHSKAPGVAKGLMNRRKDELEVRNAANYQHERKIQIFKSRK